MRTIGATSLTTITLKELNARYEADDHIVVGRCFLEGKKAAAPAKTKTPKNAPLVEVLKQEESKEPKVQINKEW